MGQRITSKDFYRATERLEKLIGHKLNTSVWHRHYSVYIAKGSACADLLASGSTAREAYNEIHACIRAIEVSRKLNNKLQEEMSY